MGEEEVVKAGDGGGRGGGRGGNKPANEGAKKESRLPGRGREGPLQFSGALG